LATVGLMIVGFCQEVDERSTTMAGKDSVSAREAA